jgi:hypothetical protein
MPLRHSLESYGMHGMRKPARPKACDLETSERCADDDDIQCAVCREMLWMPVVLGCGHAFCRLCLMTSARGPASGCPYCNRSSKLSIDGPRPVCGVLQCAVEILRPKESARLREAHYDSGDVRSLLRGVWRKMRENEQRQRQLPQIRRKATDAALEECFDREDDDDNHDDDDGADIWSTRRSRGYNRVEAVEATRDVREDRGGIGVLRHVPEMAHKNVGFNVFMLLQLAWMIAVSATSAHEWPAIALLMSVLAWLCTRVYKAARDRALLHPGPVPPPKFPYRIRRNS